MAAAESSSGSSQSSSVDSTTSASEATSATDDVREDSFIHDSAKLVTSKERRLVANHKGSISLDKLGYSWDQNDTDVRIYLAVASASAENVRCQCSKRGAALSAEAGTPPQHFFFEINGLFAPIDPEQCAARVPRSKKHVTLRLKKLQPGIEWPALRGIEDEISGHLNV